MKKGYLAALLLALFLLGGCAAEIDSSSASESGQKQNEIAISGSDTVNESGSRDVPQGFAGTELQANQTQVLGKITAVSSNEITIALAEMDRAPTGGETSDNSGDASAPGENGQSRTPPENGEGGSRPEDFSQQGEAPTGEMPSGDGASRPEGNRPSGGFAAPELTLTGEIETYAVSEGASIVKMNGDAAALADLAVDATVRLIVETAADGTQTVTQIQLF